MMTSKTKTSRTGGSAKSARAADSAKAARSGASMTSRARPDIAGTKGYESARMLAAPATMTTFLDANECAHEPFVGASGFGRYPEQQPDELVEALCGWLDVSSRNLTVTRGADEAIDCLLRAFCVPGKDNIIVCPPTFSMYEHSAILQGAATRKVPLKRGFKLDADGVVAAADRNTKIVFLCSPNNPTANLMDEGDMTRLCAAFEGRALVVVDETYIEYSAARSMAAKLEEFANLVVLRTLSKSHAAAGLRCGVAVAREDVSRLICRVLSPVPFSVPVIQAVRAIFLPENLKRLAQKRRDIIERRDAFIAKAAKTPPVKKVLPTDANFVLLQVDNAERLCSRALEAGVVLRNQSHQPGLSQAVRVSIGTSDEMSTLLAILKGKSRPANAAQRKARIVRRTSETAISVSVNLDESAPVDIHTGIGFYDHMLEQIAKHAGISIAMECDGDLHIDAHHSIEDCAIALGAALHEALGDKRGAGRYGFCLPMDEALATVALDLGGRYFLDFKADFPAETVGDLPCDMIEHIFRSLAENMKANLHIEVKGENAHHMVEACFKGFARALRQAVRLEGSEMPSTKGVL